jgi:hypothetical protein
MKKSKLQSLIQEEINSIIKEEKSLLNDGQVKKLLNNLANKPGYYINQELLQVLKKPLGVHTNTRTSTNYQNNLVDVMDDIEAIYKSVDKKVAKMIIMAIQDAEASEE